MPSRPSSQLPRPKTRRSWADLNRYGFRAAMVLNWLRPKPVASQLITIGSLSPPAPKAEASGMPCTPTSRAYISCTTASKDVKATRPSAAISMPSAS